VSEEPTILHESEQAVEGTEEKDSAPRFFEPFTESELVIGLVGAVGTDFESVVTNLTQRLKTANYDVTEIRISKDIIPELIPRQGSPSGEYERISWAMTDGDEARRKTGDNSILAIGAASKIHRDREKDADGNPKPAARRAYIINSLKHPEEIFRLRIIYRMGFYVLGVHSDEERRRWVLKEIRRIKEDADVDDLIERDQNEPIPYGQHLTKTFHLSDFFVREDGDADRLRNELRRIVDILFGHPYKTPTFDEYAMFLAFASALRSVDMSRQVGAVIADDNEIISTGANDCPAFGGGLYWPKYNPQERVIEDKDKGRDYTHGQDLNKAEQRDIISQILELAGQQELDTNKLREVLEGSRITELNEFGRAVHAEMEALLACARKGVSTKGATLYCTTFPCHNCAKHIIAAGIHRVFYIEPYEKSKAEKLHGEAMMVGFSNEPHLVNQDKVLFQPFVGVGPRHFLDFFSMRLGSGSFLEREDKNSNAISWEPEESELRLQMVPSTYLDIELEARVMYNQKRLDLREKENGMQGKPTSTNGSGS
jgi:deoxycytidylate deaminase